MVKRIALCSPRPRKDGKTFWARIGTAWPSKKNPGMFDLEFDSAPLSDNEGRCRVLMFEDNEAGTSKPSSRQSAVYELDDDIPFN